MRDEPTTKAADTDRHATRAEKKIRLFWREDIVHHEDDEHFDCGMWVAATASARRQAKIICEVQNAVYGPGSHWVEERGQGDSSSDNWPSIRVRADDLTGLLSPYF
ncbi:MULTISPECIES: hypothetical protein [unclassified Variovorax]|uniref:hypothetical protein n=1 Tax=unclassified Variovorax TaxID=663243 RepID=UPI003F452EA2